MISRFARSRPGLTWVVAVSTAELLAVVSGVGAPIQPALAVIFVLTCPGFLLFDLERPRDQAARIMIGIGGSVAANIVVVTLVLVTNAGPIALIISALLAVVGVMPRRHLVRLLSWAMSLRPAPTPETVLPRRPEPTQPPQQQPEIGPATTPESAPESAPQPQQRPEPEPYPPSVVVLGVDINRAGVGPFTGLPGIGPDLAARIVAHREEHGPFADVNALLDLLRVMAIEEAADEI
jgi:hypothetical protein